MHCATRLWRCEEGELRKPCVWWQTRDKDYGEDADATLVGRARDQHFTTTKAATDHVTVGTAYDEGAYATACTTGNVMRTVSADSPSWFQVPTQLSACPRCCSLLLSVAHC